ncbi:transglutaminase-like domain-containing protein [Pedococcus sp. KACC 23699]|uniref:Transglutaminase-like domain-containing protein n=1 Tax=Pedococcus sp. KACC 23699 TaxID=3149228 RepID=A0AAU7JYT7_9MICO
MTAQPPAQPGQPAQPPAQPGRSGQSRPSDHTTGPARDSTAPGRTRARTSWTSTRSRLAATSATSGLRPGGAALVDAAFTAVLVGVALLGFRTDFAGAAWVLPAVAGLVLGLLATHVTTAYKLPLVAPLAVVTVLYLLLGGPLAVRRDLVGGVLPSGQTFFDLADTSVHGWKRLVTLLPPVDTGNGLLALPLIVGLLGGCVTYAVARRWSSPYAVLPAPLALLALGIVLGTLEPASLAVQGAVFAVLGIGWMVVRAARTRAPLQNGAGQRTRYGIGAALIGIALLAGYFVGPQLPGADSTTRLVARSHVVPPIDIAAFASPLAGFRKYTEPNPAALWDTPLLDVRGLPAGTPLRFATLDSYDGAVWGASERANSGSLVPGASFQQVGESVSTKGPGRKVDVRVSVPQGGYGDVWLPTAGTVAGVKFAGARADTLAGRLWLNIDTNTALVPDRLEPGDSYTFTAYVPATPEKMPRSLSVGSGSLTDEVDTSFLDAKLDAFSGDAPDPWAQFVSIAKVMAGEGAYTDGGTPNSVERYYLPGHSIGRLSRFVGLAQLAGDDEQYAATLALMGNRIGVPTRVVMGAITPASGPVRGQDVHAWVEVRDSQGQWQPILPDNFLPDRDKKPKELQTKVEDRKVGALVPPPAGVNPPSVLQGPDQAQNATNLKKPPKKLFDPSAWPWWLQWLAVLGLVLLALVIVYWLIRGLKAWRRRRHATRGPPASRVAWVWADLMGSARSYGHRLPRRATRLEQAGAVHGPIDLRPLAARANGHVFGPGEPSIEEAAGYFRAATAARADLRANADFWRRLRSDVDVRPLFTR